MQSGTEFFVEYDFDVVIEPCVVDTYLDTLTAATIVYELGTPSLMNVSPFLFEQFPPCGYAETVSTTSLPGFVTHNMVEYDFTVPESYDLSLIGIYSATLEG